ncbi:DUF1015 domain-containing protein [Acidipila rosea]|uniref:Uncharacterized protein (DUF1015 family) n=1 Tax=Acidipila rosea TaxID=768535 RepID=A0A4R1L288_9BACT|nr:DUF1015 domain-containing protein [Acidipila rosea]TCK72106.1 uncharacterized protein (DUF1015 family) [Acidipila rosea]
MARIYPFRGLRYNPTIVRVQDCVTQPYDKITPAMQQAYYQKSPYNLVRIILGLPELFDENGGDVYTRAARDFTAWRESGVLAAEPEPCIFAYSQRFTVPGSNGAVAERRGFIALGELYDYAQNVIFRHEQTLSKPKSDRLNLLRATRAHFGQIFMLYSDPGLTAEKLLFSGNYVPDIEVTDEYDVQHRVWKVSDPSTINMLAGALEDKKLIIADGHHRYETALNYSRECAPAAGAERTERNTNTIAQPPHPEAAVMMTFVNMDAEGLVILPTHRVVSGLESFKTAAFLDKAKAYFAIEPCETSDASALTAKLAAVGNGATAFAAVTREGAYLLTAKPEAVAEALADLSDRQRQLDVVQLHALVLEQLLGITPEAIREQRNLRYLRDAAEAVEQAVRGAADVSLLMNPVTLNQLREVAFAGEVMPQKSTDFYPKLLSGLAIYALD